MNNKDSHHDLRKRAEAKHKITRDNLAKMSQAEIQKMTQEFQGYQKLLELQNEELRNTQVHLQEAHNRYQKLYDYAPAALLTINSNGFISDANQAICDLLGYSKTELLGTKTVKYICSEDQDGFYLFFNSIFKLADKKNIELRVKQKNGSFISIICQGCCFYNDQSENEVLLTLLDIDKQKRVELAINQVNEQLRKKVYEQTTKLISHYEQMGESFKQITQSKNELIEREAKLNSVFKAAVEGIITIDEKGIIQSINKAVTRLFGYQTDELIGQNVSMLMPSPHKELHGNYLQNYLFSHDATFIGRIRQLEGQRKDGSIMPIDLSISEYSLGRKRYFTGMIRDVSERKQKEQLDKQHLDELAHVTRMGLMGEMASGIAHEVNQPLTAITTYSRVCLNLLNNDNPDLKVLKETLQKTEKQVLRAGQIITRMREFISTDSVRRSTVDINVLVQDAISLAYDDCGSASIQCCLDLVQPLPCISADAVQIEQVLLNLIKNSIDVLDTLPKDKTRSLSVQTYLQKNEKFIEVRVKDNGPGIDKALQAQVFTPFFTTKSKGMGMGLSICQSLIMSHGGELRFNSNTNKGTTFYFTLPVLEDSHGIK